MLAVAVVAHANDSYGSRCIANLKAIDGAAQQWALEKKKTATDTYSLTDSALLAYLRGSKLPVCPADGIYQPGKSVTDSPVCSYHGTIEQASERESRPIKARNRHLNLAAWLMVTVSAALILPLPLLRPIARRRFVIALPCVTFLLICLLGSLPPPTSLIYHPPALPFLMLSGLGGFAGLLVALRERGGLRIYGLLTGGFMLLTLFLRAQF